MKFKNYPIAYKMIILCMLTTITGLLLAGIVMVAYDQYRTKQIVMQEIKVLAKVIANRSSAAILFSDDELAQTNLQSLQARPAIELACIYRLEDNAPLATKISLFANYKNGGQATQCPDGTAVSSLLVNDSVRYTINHFDLVEPIQLDAKDIGYLVIRSSLIDTFQRLRDHSTVLIAIIILAAMVALLLATRLEKLISRPLLALGGLAREIAANDDYSLRADKYGNDEVGQVVDSFNYMLTKIQQEDAELRESEEKFRLFSASSTVGIFQTDGEGRCIYANERLCQITSLPLAALLQKGWTSAIHPEDIDRIQYGWQHSLKTGGSLDINCRFETTNNKTIWVTGHIGPLHNSQGNAIGFLGTISDVSELKHAQLQLEHLAFYDMLTGLANRRLFRDRLEHIIINSERHRNRVALLFIDIDNFKHTNDTLGHDTGDALLRIIADRLHHCVRASDTVARLGGDEFTIILADINNSLNVSKIAEHLLAEICRPILLDDQEIIVTTSIGIALFPDNGANPEALIKHADLALYKAKEEGRNNYQFFIEDMNTNLVEHLQLVRDFREALHRDEFILHYQPQYRLSDYQIVGFEALVRWISPIRGFVSPMNFIPVAEETGLIIHLGEWILMEACRQMRELLDKNMVDKNVVMAVNISARQLMQDNLVDSIKQVLLRTGLSPSQLELEITESMLMENIDKGITNMDQLKELGISLSIDDFGTGYSSLGYLKKLPVHIVKVDRSFVKDIPEDKDDMEITAAVIAMAHKLNYKVVAEGLETKAQEKFLQDCHCDYGQGYMFSKPLPADELKEFLLDRKKNQSQSA